VNIVMTSILFWCFWGFAVGVSLTLLWYGPRIWRPKLKHMLGTTVPEAGCPCNFKCEQELVCYCGRDCICVERWPGCR